MSQAEARLVRSVPVRLVDFSLSGCRVATDYPIGSGAEGALTIEIDGNPYQDTVKIIRDTAHHGRSPSLVLGGVFAWANQHGTASIRGAVPLPRRTLVRRP